MSIEGTYEELKDRFEELKQTIPSHPQYSFIEYLFEDFDSLLDEGEADQDELCSTLNTIDSMLDSVEQDEN